MITSLVLALGLSASPLEATPETVEMSLINTIEQAGKSHGRTRIADTFEVTEAGKSHGRTRIADTFEVTEAGKSHGRTRI